MNLRQEQNFTLLDTLNSLDTNMESSQQTSLLAILDRIQTTSQKVLRLLNTLILLINTLMFYSTCRTKVICFFLCFFLILQCLQTRRLSISPLDFPHENRVHPSAFAFTKGSPFVATKSTSVNACEGWVHPPKHHCLSAFQSQGERWTLFSYFPTHTRKNI